MPNPSALEEARGRRLAATVRLTSWWLLAQGALLLVLNEHLAYDIGFRYSLSCVPVLRLAGLGLACLGFFLLRSLSEPRRQYLAVDVLTLFLLGHAYCLLDFRLSAQLLTVWEWGQGGVDLALAALMVLNRTRSGQMEGEATVFSAKATVLARETGRWVAGRGPKPQAGLGRLGPQGEPAAADSGAEGRKRGGSEAIPHMD